MFRESLFWDTLYINYVSQFKYLGHIVSCDMTDDEDIEREVKNMFIRTKTNIVRKFNKCSVAVKTILCLNHIVFVFMI